MRQASPRERWLFAAVLGTGLLVMASHGGVPLSCSERPMRVNAARHETLPPGYQPSLTLRRETQTPYRAIIDRGTVIRVRYDYERDAGELEGALLGVDPAGGTVLLQMEGGGTQEIELASLDEVSVLALSTGTGTGALIGGLSGAAIGAVSGYAALAGSGYEGLCAVGVGVPAGLLGTGIGAGIGSSSRTTEVMERYPIGDYDWHVTNGGARPRQTPPSAAAQKPPKSNPPENSSQPFASLPGIAGPAANEPSDPPDPPDAAPTETE